MEEEIKVVEKNLFQVDDAVYELNRVGHAIHFLAMLADSEPPDEEPKMVAQVATTLMKTELKTFNAAMRN